MATNAKILGLSSGDGLPVPLKGIDVQVSIQGYIAEVTSKLSYRNEEKDPIEAVFTFPVDDGSAVFKFEAFINGRVIVAEIQEKEQAALTYNDAKESGLTVMLLKEDDSSGDIFTCMLGNLPPRTEAQLTISYVIELPQEADGMLCFKLPTVLNPRYSPDAGSSVAAEGATYVPSYNIPYEFKMAAKVESCYKIDSVTSSKLNLSVQFEDDHKIAKVALDEEFKFDHDLCLLVKYSEPFSPQVIMENGNPDADGLLKEDMLMVSFHPDLKEVTMATTGEYIFVIDRSGSMHGQKIADAKEALLLFLKSLPADCHFNIVSFGSNYTTLFDGSKAYTEKNLNQALNLQKSMSADMGGTEIYKPLEWIFKLKCEHEPRNVFVLTDGQVSNTSEVIGLVRKHANTSRVFSLGIGAGVSTSLVNGLVRAGNGIAEFVSGNDRMQEKVVSLLKCAMQPAITNLEMNWDLPPDITPVCIPEEIPSCLTVGKRLTLYAMLQGVDMNTVYAPSSVVLQGTHESKPVTFSLQFTLSDDDKKSMSAPVHRLATKTQIKILQDKEDGMLSGEEKYSYTNDARAKDVEEIRRKIVEVSRHGNIVSKYSSFVAVDQEGSKVEGDLVQRSCPVPSCSDTFLSGLQEHDDLKSCSFDGGGARSFYKSKSKFNIFPKFKLPSFFKSKKKSSSSNYAQKSSSAKAKAQEVDNLMSDAMSDESEDVYLDAGGVMDSGPVTGDAAMMSVITLQGLDGRWTYSSKLQTLLAIPKDKLKSTDIVKEQNVLVTLVVISWLRKNYAHRDQEWKMIEAKALHWLKLQNLAEPIDKLLQTTADKFWP